MTTRNAILFAALAVAATTAGFLLYSASDGDTRGAVTVRPVFALPDLDGNERAITEWDGQALVVNFWATWCAPCLREIPLLNAMQPELAARGVQIIGIAMDDPAAVHEFAADHDFAYPVLVGEQEAVDAAAAFGAEVIGLPLTVFTRADGSVHDIHAGELSRADILRILDGADTRSASTE